MFISYTQYDFVVYSGHLEAARPRFDTALIWHILYFPHDLGEVSALSS